MGVRLHGARRATLDFDALVSFAPDNFQALCAAMRDLNARIRADGFSDAEAIAVAAAMIHPETFTRSELTTWMADAGPLDVLHTYPTVTEPAGSSRILPSAVRRPTSEASGFASRRWMTS